MNKVEAVAALLKEVDNFDVDTFTSELAELRLDRERLEWMININAIIKESYRGVWYCEFLKNGGCRAYGETTPRGAIDAAMKDSIQNKMNSSED